MSIRTLVVANSGEVSQDIASVICTHPEFEVLANCRDGFEALQAMEENSPDLMLLDVELPGMDGFQLLDAMGPGAPDVILLSNKSEHAVRAFDLEAIDLVRKPISPERLNSALTRAKQYVGRTPLPVSPAASHNRLLIRTSGKLVFIDPREVQWIEASDNYVVFHTLSERYTVRMTMNKLERSLDENRFIRIHRSTIINVEYVRELRGLAHGDYSVILRNGTELTMTRSYRHFVTRLMPEWPAS
jgi:two-component system LytT family response regulator